MVKQQPINIVIFSTSQESIDEMRFGVSQLQVDLSKQLNLIEVRLTNELTIDLLNETIRDTVIKGFILIIDKETFRMESAFETIESVLNFVSTNTDYFFLPWLKCITFNEITKAAFKGEKLAVDILENIHIDATLESMEGVVHALNFHLTTFEQKEEIFHFGRLWKRVSIWFGYLSFALSVIIIILVQVIHESTNNTQFLLAEYVKWADSVIVIILSSGAILTYHITWKCSCAIPWIILGRVYKSFIVIAHLLAVYYIISFFLPLLTQFNVWNNLDSAILGMGLSIVLISIIQSFYRNRMSTNFHKLPNFLNNSSKEVVKDFFKWAVGKFIKTGKRNVPEFYKSFFVSYSRSSEWCVVTAKQIVQQFNSFNTNVFLDTESLHVGESWKSRLQESIEEIDVFVIVLDNAACQKKWVLSEFMAAYMTKVIKRTPKIVIIKPPGFDILKVSDSNVSNIFSSILNEIKTRFLYWLKPSIIEFTEDKSKSICSNIRFYESKEFLGNFYMLVYSIFSVLSALMILCFQIIGILFVIVTPGIIALGNISIFELLSFLQNHLLIANWLVVFSSFMIGFGLYWTFFQYTRHTRNAGAFSVIGFVLVYALSIGVSNYSLILISIILFYLGLTFSSMTSRDWRKRKYNIR